MDELHGDINEFHRIAVVCGVDINDARDDIIDSMKIAYEIAAHIDFSQDQLTEDWDQCLKAWCKWWDCFLQQYSSKCVKRLVTKSGDLKDTRSMEKLWLESFESLWEAGCKITKCSRVISTKNGFTEIFSSHSKNLSETECKKLQDNLQEWIDWCDELGEDTLLIISAFKEKQRRAFAQTARDLEEFNEASLLGKLKRFISG